MRGSLPVRVRTQPSGDSREEDVLRGDEDGTHVTSASATTGEAPRPAARPQGTGRAQHARWWPWEGPRSPHAASSLYPEARVGVSRGAGRPGEHPTQETAPGLRTADDSHWPLLQLPAQGFFSPFSSVCSRARNLAFQALKSASMLPCVLFATSQSPSPLATTRWAPSVQSHLSTFLPTCKKTEELRRSPRAHSLGALPKARVPPGHRHRPRHPPRHQSYHRLLPEEGTWPKRALQPQPQPTNTTLATADRTHKRLYKQRDKPLH